MTSDSQRRSILRWTAPKNMFAVVIFTAVVVVLEYIAVSFAVSMGIKDPLGVSLSFLGITLSPLYFLVPVAVIITLTASFMHLTAKIASGTRKPEVQKKLRALNTIFIHNRYFWVYFDFTDIENNFMVPIYGTRGILKTSQTIHREDSANDKQNLAQDTRN